MGKEEIMRDRGEGKERQRKSERRSNPKAEREKVKGGKEGSLPRDGGMINVKLSKRWRGETTAMRKESWPGADKRI